MIFSWWKKRKEDAKDAEINRLEEYKNELIEHGIYLQKELDKERDYRHEHWRENHDLRQRHLEEIKYMESQIIHLKELIQAKDIVIKKLQEEQNANIQSRAQKDDQKNH